jgi:exodeoxyribonuclease VII large subunit
MTDKAPGVSLPLDFSGGESRASEEIPLRVSELLGLVSDTLRTEYADVLVLGELSSFKRAPSGHCYFALADSDGCVDAVMWRGASQRLTCEPRVGDEVVCRGYLDVFPKQGRMQLYVRAMRPVGAGATQRALEELRKRLHAEGLFDEARKRPLPFFPKTIGVVTSRAGAAVHDILTTIRRRCRPCRVILSAASVQGPEAPRELLATLRGLELFGECDVVIIGRGGGAVEDLSAFNDEALVRAVAAFPVPVVSAVGHEIDFTLCDFAADHRAATPTAAAELVVPVHSDLTEDLHRLDLRLHGGMRRRVTHLRDRVGNLSGKLKDPARLVARVRQRADDLGIRMERALAARHRRAVVSLDDANERLQRVARTRAAEMARGISKLDERLRRGTVERAAVTRTRFTALSAKLDALSPLAVLDRGYSLVTRADGRLVRSAAEIQTGATVGMRFHRGSAAARVLSTETDEES